MTPHFDSSALNSGTKLGHIFIHFLCSKKKRDPLTSKVRISCCVRSLDAAHLVRSPCKLEMEISIIFWMSSH